MIKKKAGITPKKVTKKFVYPSSLPVADFLHIYELYCRRTFVLDETGYRTWPDVSIEEAYAAIAKSTLTVADVLGEGGAIADSHKQTKEMFSAEGKLNIGELKSAYIERRCAIGYAIPLLLEFYPEVLVDGPDMRLTLVYAWASCVRDKVSSEIQAAKQDARHKPNQERHRGSLVTFEIECSIEQAIRLDEYIQIRVEAYSHWSDYLRKVLKDKRRVSAGPPVSTVVTEFRKKYPSTVPRSLILRSMNHATSDWQNWLDAKRQHGKHPSNISKKSLNSFSLSSSFSFSEMGTALTIADIENIPISKVVGGELDVTKEFKYLIVNARLYKKSLIYSVTGQYKK